MRVLQLPGHYGSAVEIDLCAPCHLVWFDVVESARLSGPGLLALIGEMAAAQSLAHQPLRRDLGCPHCHGAVRTVHNRTRWGRSLQLECLQRHGAWQTFGEFLNEKGLLRPMSSADRARALQRPEGLHCVNCGGAVGATDTVCAWCRSVPAVVDVARLAHALDPEGATAEASVHRTGERPAALACRACGAAVPADAHWHCQHCGATLTAPDLAEAHRQVCATGPGAAGPCGQAGAAHRAAAAGRTVGRIGRDSASAPPRCRPRPTQRSGRVADRWISTGDDDRSLRLPAWVWVLAAVLALLWWW